MEKEEFWKLITTLIEDNIDLNIIEETMLLADGKNKSMIVKQKNKSVFFIKVEKFK